jgi:hypothetical protein
MQHKPQVEAASIVMVGSFNPAIFQPAWLSKQQLIRPEEADDAKIALIQAEAAAFSTEWFQLQVLPDRFQLSCTDPRQYGPLRDLAIAIFAILPHTPVKALGLNRHFHFEMPTLESWHAVGHCLAPKEPWELVLDNPGMRSITMEGQRPGTTGGLVKVRVEPSIQVKPGVFVEVNEEFRVTEGDEGARWAGQRTADHWDTMLAFAEVVAEHLLGLEKEQ